MHSLEIHGRLDRNSSKNIYSPGERELTANSWGSVSPYGFHKTVDLEITDFKVFLDNITLIRTINNNDQRKELIGIIYDIRSISSGFTSIFFVHIPLSDSPAKLSLCLAVLNPNLD